MNAQHRQTAIEIGDTVEWTRELTFPRVHTYHGRGVVMDVMTDTGLVVVMNKYKQIFYLRSMELTRVAMEANGDE